MFSTKVSHIHAVKRIFRYLKGQPKLGLWYPKDSPFDLVAYTDSDYVRASLDRKSTTGECQFLGCRLISWQCKKQTVVANSTTEADYVAALSYYGQVLWIHNQLLDYSAKTTAWNEFSSTVAFAIICLATNQKFNFSKYIFESMVKNLENVSDNVSDKAVNEEMDDSLVRVATTATGLDAKQDSCNIDKTQSKATPNEPSSIGTSLGGCPKRQDTMRDTIAQTRSENVSKYSSDLLLARGNTLRSGEDRLKLQELMELCTTLQSRVLDLENTKTVQAQEITSLKLRVKKLEKKGGSRTHKLKRLYKITLVDETQGRYSNDIMFDVSDLAGEEVFVAEQRVPDSKKDDVVSIVGAATTVSTASTILVSAALITNVEITLAQVLAELKSAKPTPAASTRPRAKVLVIHEQEQASTSIFSSQQPSQAKIQDKGKEKKIEPEHVKKLSKKDQLKLDEEVAQRLQAEFDEQERIKRDKAEKEVEVNRKEESTLQRKGQKKRGTNHLPKLLSEKHERMEAQRSKEQVDEDKEIAELKSLMQVILDEEEVAIDAIPLATKPPTIIDWKIHKKGKNSYYQIIRADGSSKMYKGRVVRIKRLHDDLEVTAAKLMLLVYKLLLLVKS
ncbi:hypothetical protein Tco_1392516 [Tanacetum coccineum]